MLKTKTILLKRLKDTIQLTFIIPLWYKGYVTNILIIGTTISLIITAKNMSNLFHENKLLNLIFIIHYPKLIPALSITKIEVEFAAN